jgi:hypothetical protein
MEYLPPRLSMPRFQGGQVCHTSSEDPSGGLDPRVDGTSKEGLNTVQISICLV